MSVLTRAAEPLTSETWSGGSSTSVSCGLGRFRRMRRPLPDRASRFDKRCDVPDPILVADSARIARGCGEKRHVLSELKDACTLLRKCNAVCEERDGLMTPLRPLRPLREAISDVGELTSHFANER